MENGWVAIAMPRLIDLENTPLRNHWTEADFEYLLKSKERLFALIAVKNMPRTGPIDDNDLGQGDFGLVNQRRWTPLDRHLGFNHPRDLPIDGFAYQSLFSYARDYVLAGRYQLPPDWQQRWPDIAADHAGHIHHNDEFPIRDEF